MKNTAFRYEFTARELRYILFFKKVCPRCGGKLEKRKEFEIKKGSDFVDQRGYYLPKNADVKHYLYFYDCQQCGARYPLRELADQKG